MRAGPNSKLGHIANPTSLGAPVQPRSRPASRHCGTGIAPDRDTTASWRDVDGPARLCRPCRLAGPRAPRGNCRLFDTARRIQIVRIHLPPADSPSLVGFLLPVSKSRQLPRRVRAWPGGMTGRDLSGSSPSRQLPVMSLSGAIPVPQRPSEAVCGPWSHWYQARGVSDVT